MDKYLSPYSSPDSFAGNWYLIDLESLDEEKILSEKDWASIQKKEAGLYRKNKEILLRKIFTHWFQKNENHKILKSFYDEEAWWMADHLRYFNSREEKLENSFIIFLQYIFSRQYQRMRKYANESGISIFGDLPFYVNFDSRDVWANGKYFLLNKNNKPIFQSAVPPDIFQKKGQLWGTPVYDWDALKEDNFDYWYKKVKRLSMLYDYLRIDHFRGLEAYYRILFNSKDATMGEWIKVPGDELLKRIKEVDGINLIAENLGFLTPEVDYLLEKHQLPGMKIMQFSLHDIYSKGSKRDTVYYTGTHDNQPLLSWVRETFKPEKTTEKEIVWDFIVKLYSSEANWVIVPLQDLLCLGEEARMNTPGTIKNNWLWTYEESIESLEGLQEKLKTLTKKTNRS